MEDEVSVCDDLDLREIFRVETIEWIPQHADKRATLGQLVSSLATAGHLPIDLVQSTIESLVERERYGTTGIGKGLAFPHVRMRGVREFVGAIGVAIHGVDFSSLDGLPTRLVFLLLSPFSEREHHTEIMARLAALMSDKTLQYSIRAENAGAATETSGVLITTQQLPTPYSHRSKKPRKAAQPSEPDSVVGRAQGN